MKKMSVILLVLFLLSAPLALAQEDSITITTYYPSPYGVYNELRLYPHVTSTICESKQEGLVYYNSSSDSLNMCICTPICQWVSFGAGPWVISGNNIYNTNSGNVGIGTGPTAPAYKLDVSGNVRFSGDVRWTGTLRQGYVPWGNLTGFPPACSGNTFVKGIGSTLSCATPPSGGGVVPITCPSGQAITGVDADGNFTCGSLGPGGPSPCLVGGRYSTRGVGGACTRTNPVTGSCSCPAGYAGYGTGWSDGHYDVYILCMKCS